MDIEIRNAKNGLILKLRGVGDETAERVHQQREEDEVEAFAELLRYLD